MDIRELAPADFDWIHKHADAIGGRQVVSRGTLHTLAAYPGFIAQANGDPLGYAVYREETDTCELLAMQALTQWQGVGSALLAALEDHCVKRGVHRIWLSTTNDNLPALRFYQRRGYRLQALHPGAFANVLRMKGLDPAQEVTGVDGVVIRDELVLEKPLEKD